MKLQPIQEQMKQKMVEMGVLKALTHVPWSQDDSAYWTRTMELIRNAYRMFDLNWTVVSKRLKRVGGVDGPELSGVLSASVSLMDSLLRLFVVFEEPVDHNVFFPDYHPGQSMGIQEELRTRYIFTMQNQTKSYYSALAGEWRRFIQCHRAQIDCPTTDLLNTSRLMLKALLEWHQALEVDYPALAELVHNNPDKYSLLSLGIPGIKND